MLSVTPHVPAEEGSGRRSSWRPSSSLCGIECPLAFVGRLSESKGHGFGQTRVAVSSAIQFSPKLPQLLILDPEHEFRDESLPPAF